MNPMAPFLHHARSTNQLMRLVCLALIPGAIAEVIFLGWGVLVNLFLCGLYALIAEAIILKVRNKPIITTLSDHSALLTGLLIALAIPPILPWWMSMLGVFFAIIIAKQLYGGLGLNPFNPAMVGYVLLLISFPVEMTSWLPSAEFAVSLPSFMESLQLTLFGSTSNGSNLLEFRNLADGYTMATPLDASKTALSLGNMTSEILNTNEMLISSRGWMLVNLCFLAGGLYMLAARVIHWHIPVSYLASITICSSLLYLFDNQTYMPSSFHWFTGATMLGAFFIATDPVSASTTFKGRIIYGALIGFLIIVIRTFGGYPDAVAFSVLLLNIATPTIDHYTRSKIYGEKNQVNTDD